MFLRAGLMKPTLAVAIVWIFSSAASLVAAERVRLFNGKNLDNWEVIGDGSIYGFADAPKDAQHDDDWNTIEISSRNDKITVKLNRRLVAEHPGDPKRPKVGPIGLQLHDQFSIIMFRNVWIRQIE